MNVFTFFRPQISWYTKNLLLIIFTFASTSNIFSQAVPAGVVPVTPPTGNFAIDGNLLATDTGDWQPGTGSGGSVLNAAGVPLVATTTFHPTDLFTQGDDVFIGGLKKNDNLNSMRWKNANPSPAKCDINHFLMHVAEDQAGDTWITLAGDREATTGNSFISIALLQKKLTQEPGGAFLSLAPDSTGARTLGDVQISAEFTGGGTNPNLYLEEWRKVGTSYQWVAIPVPSNSAFGKTNATAITSLPYTVFGGTSYTANSFIEVSFNISAIYRSTAVGCVGSIASMFVMTKSSQAVNADLTDFVTPIQINLDITVGEPTASGANYCVNETISNLTVTGESGATFKWYTGIGTDGKPTGTGTEGASFNPNLNNTIPDTVDFYVTQSLRNCESDPTKVTIIINAKPAVYSLSGNNICSAAPNTGVITLADSDLGISYQLKKASDKSTVQTAQAGTGSALTWNGLAAGIDFYVVATGPTPTNCKDSTGNASIGESTNPSQPSLSFVNPTCSTATGTVTVTEPLGTNYRYKYNAQDYQESPGPFTFNAGAGFTLIVKDMNTGCESSPGSCAADASLSNESRVEEEKTAQKLEDKKTEERAVDNYRLTIPSGTKVLAAPNPYTDRVRFTIESAQSGLGSLEIFNTLGQKVKVVFSGYVEANRLKIIEYNIPSAQRASLMYVFTIGNQRVTGKLISR